jgi:hypothetical protein
MPSGNLGDAGLAENRWLKTAWKVPAFAWVRIFVSLAERISANRHLIQDEEHLTM